MLTVLLLACATAIGAGDEKIKLGEFIPANPAQPAPDIAFTDMDGNPAHFADFTGKPVIVNLWATWCAPCVQEMPALVALQKKLDGKLLIAAISEDRGGARVVAPFVAENKIQGLKIFLDPKSAATHAFAVRGLPTSIVLDANGRVVGRIEGPAEWGSPKMLDTLKPVLAH
jgi:thiol-disulfide isomerase/thioredoxin